MTGSLGNNGETDVVALYGRLAGEIGRNNALYRCASIARDEGRNESDVVALLGAYARLGSGSRRDTGGSPEMRMSEALRTISSAFSKGHGISILGSGIPNSLREFLLGEQGSTVLIRLLEVFRLAKWRENDWFKLGDAMQVAAGFGLNRKSVLEALGGESSVYDGNILYEEICRIPGQPGTKTSTRGRPCQVLYQAPAIGVLMRRLGLVWSPSDSIGADDIRTAHRYRLALHRGVCRAVVPEVPRAGWRRGLVLTHVRLLVTTWS